MTIQRVPEGATHYSRVTTEGESDMAVCLRESTDPCEVCGAPTATWQPLGQEGGPGPACVGCMLDVDWSAPRPLPLPADLPTHL